MDIEVGQKEVGRLKRWVSQGSSYFIVITQNKEGILPVATLSIVLYVSYKSRSSSNFAREV